MNQSRSVSVVIPTHNRCATLRRTLDALAAQTYALKEVQVVVVADGCIDDTIPMLRRYEAPFTLRVIEQPGHGAATARNLGATVANGGFLIFLDDDIEPVPAFIEAHVGMHQRQATCVAIGYSVPVLEGSSGFWEIAARKWWQDVFNELRQPGHRYTYRDVLSGNLSMSRELWTQIGGFDPAFKACHSGEDYELGIRLIRAGATLAFAAEARGYHRHLPDLDRSFHRTRQDGRADVMIARRHPEVRSILAVTRLEGFRSRLNRVVRTIAFRVPSVGDSVAAGFRRSLDVLERGCLRSRWGRVCERLRIYWYWRGVAEEVGDQHELARLLHQGPAFPDPDRYEIELDLRDGLGAAEHKLDEIRPMGARLRFGRQPVGRIPPEPGAERLRGAHLRPFLAKQLAQPLLTAIAIERATDGPSRSGRTAGGVFPWGIYHAREST